MPDNPTHVALLEVVAKHAAEIIAREGYTLAEECGEFGLLPGPGNHLASALVALRAHTPAKGETVEVRVCVGRDDAGRYYAYGTDHDADDDLRAQVESCDYEPVCMATIPAPAGRPILPTIRAEVEP